MRPICGYAHNHTIQLLIAFLLLRLMNREECHLEIVPSGDEEKQALKMGSTEGRILLFFAWS